MWVEVLAVLALLLAGIYYKFVFAPKRKMLALKKQYEALGFKVSMLEFAPFSVAFLKLTKKDYK